MKVKHSIIWITGFLFVCNSVFAQQDAAELAKKLSNPISSLISVPFQNNTDYGIGDLKGSRNTMNIQPVVPLSLTPKLNLITRIIMPVTTQYNITGAGEKQSGLGDFVLSGFISPKATKNGITWGAGPVFLLATGTNDYFATKKFGIRPTAVALANQWLDFRRTGQPGMECGRQQQPAECKPDVPAAFSFLQLEKRRRHWQ
ncbi:MAG TPA: hypothetical protein VFW07_26755 [Parafilimonas sp.]|nr:hypothetical protein [Parafilimonas sp.]